MSVDLKTPSGPTAPKRGEFWCEYEVNPPPGPGEWIIGVCAGLLGLTVILGLAYAVCWMVFQLVALFERGGAQ